MTDLEKQIYGTVKEAIGEAIKSRMSVGYHDTPLNKVIDAVVVSKMPVIQSLVEESIEWALSGDIRREIKDACAHKLARVLVSKMEGEIEKQANELRSSPEMRAKITLAISAVIKEFAAKG